MTARQWHVGYHHGKPAVFDATPAVVATCGFYPHDDKGDGTHLDALETMTLMAAAPELLAACKAVLDWADREAMPQGGKADGPWESIEAAIAKAEGR